MNAEEVTCDVCGELAHPREWLRCALCGRRYHYAMESGLSERDCGVVMPNPQSQNGC